MCHKIIDEHDIIPVTIYGKKEILGGLMQIDFIYLKWFNRFIYFMIFSSYVQKNSKKYLELMKIKNKTLINNGPQFFF